MTLAEGRFENVIIRHLGISHLPKTEKKAVREGPMLYYILDVYREVTVMDALI